MPETTPPNTADAGHEVRSYFIRNRNVLLARADFGPMYVDYYLHLSANQIKVAPEHDALFKRALAAFTLHCASRPWNEMTAWTINFQQPLVNLFLTGDNETGAVTGRVFDENVKEGPENLFFADVVRGQQAKRRSAVTFEGADPIVAAEKFYAQSEQRSSRYFQLGEEEFAMVNEHPDCDLAWFSALTAEQVRRLDESETLAIRVRDDTVSCASPRTRIGSYRESSGGVMPLSSPATTTRPVPSSQADAVRLIVRPPPRSVRRPRRDSRSRSSRRG